MPKKEKTTMRIAQLYVYPIKSLRGCPVDAAEATMDGFTFDRRFMLLRDYTSDMHNSSKGARYKGMAVSHFPAMCLFRVSATWPTRDEPHGGTLHVTHTDPATQTTSTADLPLQPDYDTLEPMPIDMHSSECTGYNMGNTLNEWFSQRFGFNVLLIYVGPNRRRVLGNLAPNAAVRNPIRKQYEARQRSWLGSFTNQLPFVLGGTTPDADVLKDYHIAFQDVAPYLIVTRSSVADVTRRLGDGEVADETKFRPNIVLEGETKAWEEDYWAELELNSHDNDYDNENDEPVVLSLTSNCVRCTSLNVDYATGKPGKGPAGQMLKTLMVDRRVDAQAKYEPVFGRYGFIAREHASTRPQVLRVGQEVSVSRRNASQTAIRWPGFSGVPADDTWAV